MSHAKIFFAVVFLGLVGAACGSSDSGGGGGSSTGLRLNTEADFTSSASAALKATTTGVCADRTDLNMDGPFLANGSDCDSDGGLVAHITPSTYAIALKRVSLVPADDTSTPIDFIADSGTLAQSEVVTFTSNDTAADPITIDPNSLSAGTYSGIEAEIYYFQMTFPVDGVAQNVRTYVSDDDFTAEGSLGHHQGDITYISDNGTELGWIGPTWSSNELVTTRGEDQNGAGNNNATNGDSETGHQRGYFGNEELWDQADLMQGADQDIYIFAINFDEPLTIPDPATIDGLTTITITFSTADTFYYEDFATKGTGWNPAAEGQADTGEWAPLTPTAAIQVEATK